MASGGVKLGSVRVRFELHLGSVQIRLAFVRFQLGFVRVQLGSIRDQRESGSVRVQLGFSVRLSQDTVRVQSVFSESSVRRRSAFSQGSITLR